VSVPGKQYDILVAREQHLHDIRRIDKPRPRRRNILNDIMMEHQQVATQPGSLHLVNNPADFLLRQKTMLLAFDGTVDQMNAPTHTREVRLSVGFVHWKRRRQEGRIVMVSGNGESIGWQGLEEVPCGAICLRSSIMGYVATKQRNAGINVRRTSDSRQDARKVFIRRLATDAPVPVSAEVEIS